MAIIAENLIKKYNQQISGLKINRKENSEKIIKTIIIFVKAMLNLHVKSDGNGRLCAHHLLNLLLLQNGFSPTILKNNCLDAFAINELYQRVTDGMFLFHTLKSKQEILTDRAGKIKDQFLSINKEKSKLSDFSLSILQNNPAKEKLDPQNLSAVDWDLFTNCSSTSIDWLLHPEDKYLNFKINGIEYNQSFAVSYFTCEEFNKLLDILGQSETNIKDKEELFNKIKTNESYFNAHKEILFQKEEIEYLRFVLEKADKMY